MISIFYAVMALGFNFGIRIARAAGSCAGNDLIASLQLVRRHNVQASSPSAKIEFGRDSRSGSFYGVAFTHHGIIKSYQDRVISRGKSSWSTCDNDYQSRHLSSRKNKFAIYRKSLAARTNDDISAESERFSIQKGQEAAQSAVSVLAQKSRTWKRLSSIVELATHTAPTTSSHNSPKNCSSIADIGCDHGLLAIALASSGRFEQVIGADISPQAIQNGALNFYSKVMEVLERDDPESYNIRTNGYESILPVEFRVGNGLEALNPGEADAICLAGMGVPTMLSILGSEKEVEDGNIITQIEYLGTKSVYLQPPTARPIKLMELYKGMHESGWVLSDERIVFLKKRWYITSAFHRRKESSFISMDDFLLPGHFLSQSDSEDDTREYSAYLAHHLKWLNRDFEAGRRLDDHELRWRKTSLNLST